MAITKGVPLRDTNPDYFPYRDTGCEISPSCLACPLPVCKYDNPQIVTRLKNASRDSRILELRSRNAKVEEIVREVGVSKRTVGRVIAATRGA